MWGVEPRGTKFIIRRCINFHESRQGRNNKGLDMKVLENMGEKTQFEVEVHDMDNSSSDKMII